jgi:hypothetical protein
MKLFTNKEIDAIYDKFQEMLNFGDDFKIIYYTSGKNLGKYALLKCVECNDNLLLEGSITIVNSTQPTRI